MEPFLPQKSRATRSWLRPLGQAVPDVVKPALAARGMSEASLVSHWVEIVGETIAVFARPEQLQWPPRAERRDPEAKSAPATLILRIDGAYALEASHLSERIIARVNAHFGWRCVHKIAFRQGPLPPLKPPRRLRQPPGAEALAAASELVRDVEDEPLRQAMAIFGARVIESAERKKQASGGPKPIAKGRGR